MPTQTYFELLEMMQAEADLARASRVEHVCPICRLVLKAADGLLRLLSLENVNDIATRQSLQKAGGFCNRHAYQWVTLHDALGTAIIYEDLLRETNRRIKSGEFAPRKNSLFGRSNPPSPSLCPICSQQTQIEDRIVSDFAEGFEEFIFRQAYAHKAVAGLCLPHYRQVATLSKNAELATAQQIKFAATQVELHLLIEKMDAGNTEIDHEIGLERKALSRAIWQMAGLEDVR